MINKQIRRKLVAIGGGTGLSTLLRGLKRYVTNSNLIEKKPEGWIKKLSAVVTVTDDGGSSGRLRRELHVLPPGDIRNCMVALAEDEALMTQLFKYRFTGDGHLQGHSFGNLFLTAMAAVVRDFPKAIRLAGKALSIKGSIYPSTVEDALLAAELADGQRVKGETNITESGSRIHRLWLEPAQPKALPEALAAILEADIITIGPGSLFTSILPNLLVPEITEAISISKAKKIFICNVMTQPGETDGFNDLDHLLTVLQYAPQIRFDAMLVNSTPPKIEQYRKYAEKGALPVNCCASERVLMHVQKTLDGHSLMIKHCDMLDDNNHARHNPEKLASVIRELAQYDLRHINQINRDWYSKIINHEVKRVFRSSQSA